MVPDTVSGIREFPAPNSFLIKSRIVSAGTACPDIAYTVSFRGKHGVLEWRAFWPAGTSEGCCVVGLGGGSGRGSGAGHPADGAGTWGRRRRCRFGAGSCRGRAWRETLHG